MAAQQQEPIAKGFPFIIFMITITLMSLIGLLSSNLYLLSLPTIAEHFGVTTTAIQITISFYVLGFAISQIIYGTLSDRFGRKIVLIYGVSLYIVTSIIGMLVHNIESMMLVRFAQGIGAGSGMVIGRAILNDLYPRERVAQILATIFPFIGSMPAFGPLIGGYISFYFGWQGNFMFFTVLGIVTLLLLIFSMKESLKQKTPISASIFLHNYYTIMSTKLFLKYTFILMLGTGVYFVFLTDAAFVFNYSGLSKTYSYLFFIFIGTMFILGNLTARRLLKVLKSVDKPLLIATVIAFSAAVASVIFTAFGVNSILALTISAAIAVFANGILVPFAYAASNALFPKMLGTASGAAGLMQIIGAFLGGTSVGYFYTINIHIQVVIGPIVGVLILLLMISAYEEKKRIAK